MTDVADVYYIGNLILNGMGDGQSSQMLSLVPMPQRVIAPNYARMQIRRVEIVRNFVARQIEVNRENRVTRRLILLRRNENESNDHSQSAQRQHRSRSQQRLRRNDVELRGTEEGSRRMFGVVRRNSIAGSRIGPRRRSMLRVRVRSLPPNASVLHTAAASQSIVTNENNVENSRE